MMKFVSDASTALNRAVQSAEESLGKAEKTEYDPEFLKLVAFVEAVELWSDKILKSVETVLQPNPGYRMEDFMYEKVDGKKKERLSPADDLSKNLKEASLALAADSSCNSSYAAAMQKFGEAEESLGQAERIFVQSSFSAILEPLKGLLDKDIKTVHKERKELESRRLDLDIAKGKAKKAAAEAEKKPNEDMTKKAEAELNMAQDEFDKHLASTKLHLEGVISSQDNMLRCLKEYIDLQATYYANCNQFMVDLKKSL